jgi:monoamine oxidase
VIDAIGAEGNVSLHADRVLITVPVGVLQARPTEPGGIEFVPALPQEKWNSIKGIEMGKVIRVVLHFRQRFWEQIHPHGEAEKTLADMSFLFSQDEWFPTWWTGMPETIPFITGWAADRCAAKLEADSMPVVTRALQRLGVLLGVGTAKMERLLDDAHFHNWQSDPYSRGAYSYVKAGSANAPESLGQPVENTLFFAGEASDITGNNGTVHGAIASARLAVAEIISSQNVQAAD